MLSGGIFFPIAFFIKNDYIKITFIMKKIILIAAMLLGTIAQAQIVVSTNGTTITNNQEFEYNTVGSSAKMQILVTNNTPQTVYYKIQLVSVSNNTVGIGGKAGQVQLCFGQNCIIYLGAGNTYPEGAVSLAPNGGHNDLADHFVNEYVGDNAEQDVVYTFKVIQTDAAQNVLGEIVTFTYRYSSTASVSDFNALKNIGIDLGSTVVKNQLDVTASQNAKLELFNINGQMVKSFVITAGTQSLDASAMAAGIYVARFTNEENKSSQVRIVKQ